MQYAIVQLRRQGVRLSREELLMATPIVGDLRVSDWITKNSAKRVLRKAEVIGSQHSFERPICPALFEPVLIRMNSRWFVLRGWQIEAEGRVMRELCQEWLVRESTAPHL